MVRVLICVDPAATFLASVYAWAACEGFAKAFLWAGLWLAGRAARCGRMSIGLLIVGGGLAAQRCCETLRALGHDGR